MRTRTKGYTLLELLVVVAIVGVLLSIGVGVFVGVGRRNKLEATTNAVRAIVRRARNAAREERAPAVVELDPVAREVRAATRETLVLFRFEAEQLGAMGVVNGTASSKDPVPEFEVKGSYGIPAQVIGADPVEGRIGDGLEFKRKGAHVSVPHRPSLAPAEGVAIEAWVLPARLEDLIPKKEEEPSLSNDERRRIDDAGTPPTPTPPRAIAYWARHADEPPLFTVARKGRAFELAVTGGYALQVAVTGRLGKGEVTYVARTEDLALTADKWARIQLVFDGREIGCWVDGLRRSLLPIKDHDQLPTALVIERAPVSISDPDPSRAFAGIIDEVKLQGVLRSERYEIPKDVALLAPATEIAFDALGGLDPLKHAEPVVFWLSDAQEALVALEPPAESDRPQTRQKAPPPDPAARGYADPEKTKKFAAIMAKQNEGNKKQISVELTGAIR